MTLKEKAQDIYMMMSQGQMREACEKYYHDDVVVKDGLMEVRNGKAAQLAAIDGWLKSLKEMHGGGVDSVAVDEDNSIVMIESWFDGTFQDGNRMKMTEIAVQKWDGDKIVEERFYYNVPPQN